jgi:hypothetical protein
LVRVGGAGDAIELNVAGNGVEDAVLVVPNFKRLETAVANRFTQRNLDPADPIRRTANREDPGLLELGRSRLQRCRWGNRRDAEGADWRGGVDDARGRKLRCGCGIPRPGRWGRCGDGCREEAVTGPGGRRWRGKGSASLR